MRRIASTSLLFLALSCLCFSLSACTANGRQLAAMLVPGGASGIDQQIECTAGRKEALALALLPASHRTDPATSQPIGSSPVDLLTGLVSGGRVDPLALGETLVRAASQQGTFDQFGILLACVATNGELSGQPLSIICPAGDVERQCKQVNPGDKIRVWGQDILPGLVRSSKVNKV